MTFKNPSGIVERRVGKLLKTSCRMSSVERGLIPNSEELELNELNAILSKLISIILKYLIFFAINFFIYSILLQ